jgi:hypothetical protein
MAACTAIELRSDADNQSRTLMKGATSVGGLDLAMPTLCVLAMRLEGGQHHAELAQAQRERDGAMTADRSRSE